MNALKKLFLAPNLIWLPLSVGFVLAYSMYTHTPTDSRGWQGVVEDCGEKCFRLDLINSIYALIFWCKVAFFLIPIFS